MRNDEQHVEDSKQGVPTAIVFVLALAALVACCVLKLLVLR